MVSSASTCDPAGTLRGQAETGPRKRRHSVNAVVASLVLLTVTGGTSASAADSILSIVDKASRQGLGSLADYMDHLDHGMPPGPAANVTVGGMIGGAAGGYLTGRAVGLDSLGGKVATFGGVMAGKVAGEKAAELWATHDAAQGQLGTIAEQNRQSRQALTANLQTAIEQCVQSGDTVEDCASSDEAMAIREQMKQVNHDDCLRARPYALQQLDTGWKCN